MNIISKYQHYRNEANRAAWDANVGENISTFIFSHQSKFLQECDCNKQIRSDEACVHSVSDLSALDIFYKIHIVWHQDIKHKRPVLLQESQREEIKTP